MSFITSAERLKPGNVRAVSTLNFPTALRSYYRSPRDRDRGCFWTHYHACQVLTYTTDRNAKPQVCKASTA